VQSENADGCAHSWLLVGITCCLLLVLPPRLPLPACQQHSCLVFGWHDDQATARTTLQDAFSK